MRNSCPRPSSSSLICGTLNQQSINCSDDDESNKIGMSSANEMNRRRMSGDNVKIDKLINLTVEKNVSYTGNKDIVKNRLEKIKKEYTMPVTVALDIIRNPYQNHYDDKFLDISSLSRPGSSSSDLFGYEDVDNEIETSKNVFLSKNYDDIFHNYSKKLKKSSKEKKQEKKERGYLLDQFSKREFGDNNDEFQKMSIGNKYGKKTGLGKSCKLEDQISRRNSCMTGSFVQDKSNELFLFSSISRIGTRSQSLPSMKTSTSVAINAHWNEREREKENKEGQREEEEEAEKEDKMKETKIEGGEERKINQYDLNYGSIKKKERDKEKERDRENALEYKNTGGRLFPLQSGSGIGTMSRSQNLVTRSADFDYCNSSSLRNVRNDN